MAIRLKTALVSGWMLLTTGVMCFLAVERAAADPKTVTFDTINVQRVNILEPDGKPRLLIASKARMSNAYWRGKEVAHKSHGGGGFLFFNDEGTEAGGMGWGGGSVDGKYYAGANLNFDQYEQDNTLQFVYDDNNGERIAGLRVKDRPNQSLWPAIELKERLAKTKDPAERARLEAQFEALAKPMIAGTANRFFAGKQVDESVVRLADKQGHDRLVLKVDGKGQASIEFLDTTGKVVRRIAER